MTTSWHTLPNEIKLEIFKYILCHPSFLSVLPNINLTSKHWYALAQDNQLWQWGIRAFFPILKQQNSINYIHSPFELFRNHYLAILPILKKYNLTWDDFAKACFTDDALNQTEIDENLKVLLWMFSENQNYSALLSKLPKGKIREYYLLSIQCGNQTIADCLTAHPWIEKEEKLRGLKCAIEFRQTQIGFNILDKISYRLTSSDITECINLSLTHHANALAQHFFKTFDIRLSSRTFGNALLLCVTHHNEEMLKTLHQDFSHRLSSAKVIEAAQLAAKNNDPEIVKLITSLWANKFSPYQMSKIQKLLEASSKKDSEIQPKQLEELDELCLALTSLNMSGDTSEEPTRFSPNLCFHAQKTCSPQSTPATKVQDLFPSKILAKLMS